MTDRYTQSGPLPEGIKALALSEDVILPRLGKPLLSPRAQGSFVSVRPCDPQYGDKTYLGIYLGDLPIGLGQLKDHEDGVVKFKRTGMGNPCIYVPELGQLVYGMESWWGTIDKPEDLKAITDADIDNVWYVRAMKAMAEKAEGA